MAADPGEEPTTSTPAKTPEGQETRTGYVTLLGAPNSGKSTLLNALVGERLSIVTDRPQTTWWRVTGIRTDGTTQMIFLDTPGVLQPGSLIQRAFVEEVHRSLRDADVVLLVLDPVRPLSSDGRKRLTSLLAGDRSPTLIPVVNKVDAASREAVDAEARWAAGLTNCSPHRISALGGTGIPDLLEAIQEELPPGPFLYPADELATSPVRFFVAELVRETVFERFQEEIPYSVFCQVEEFREGGSPIYIQVNIFVERASQKGILIGSGGQAIREVGRAAREKIEHFLGAPVYLDLWVKVLPRWRKKRGQLRRMGFSVPENDAAHRVR